MRIIYQITFYELGAGEMRSVFLKSDTPHPAMLLGDTFHSKDIAGLEAFSPILEIVHSQQHISTLNRGETHHQQLVFTRACNPPAAHPPIQDFGHLTGSEMMGDM